MKTIELLVSGRVQKVGFRACVRHIATSLGVSGEVENLADGRVRVLATGEDVILEKFTSMLYGCPRAIIRDMTVNEYIFTQFPDFSIKRTVFL
ncbi:MAG: acylphosphatase [Methanocalculus sp. MSAO_Arc1]|uniref:acylphosphatase n=1 Tax=Methanocalculus TaxID=71151 RepID=UPI000FF53B8D|nr:MULTISPECIES: acylphosphatase [unclassified Methanocalculus]MCP1663223.1 acylphosphatase [Methanocalculus sp. AMF5]RQD80694.1 MAG: acylphosphatase [Methanocalculus sp. MSAO_Arc1]